VRSNVRSLAENLKAKEGQLVHIALIHHQEMCGGIFEGERFAKM
jgi:hypothetical protein